MSAVSVLAVLMMLAAAIAPKLGVLSVFDVLLALSAPFLWRAWRGAPVPDAVSWTAALWVTSGALSAVAALLAGVPERPAYVVLTLLRRSEVVLALLAGAVAGARGAAPALQGTLLLAGGAAGLYGLVTRLLPFRALPGLSGERVARSFERGLYVAEANHFAGLFAIVVALALPLAASRRPSRLRRAAWLGLLLGGAGILTTASRLGLAALAGGAAVAAILSGRRANWLGVGLAVGCAAALPAGFERRIVILVDAALGAHHGPSALSDRADNWSMAVDGFLARPVLGAGPGVRHMAVHDSEVLLALEGGGVVGALSMVLFLLTLWSALRGRERPGGSGALVAICLLSLGLVAFHVVRTAIPFALVAGALLGERTSGIEIERSVAART